MRNYPWNLRSQKTTSAGTSINSAKVPAVFNKITWRPNTRNADVGGGKFDNATNMLFEKGVRNIIYDPFNRSEAHNDLAVELIEKGQCDTCVCANVLNVIEDPEARLQVVHQAADTIKPHGEAYFQVYEGDRSGIPKATCKGHQENRKAETYMREIQQVFRTVQKVGDVIIARHNPRKLDSESPIIGYKVYIDGGLRKEGR